MPLRALEWTEMKSSMNLKVFRTLNRYHISKIHENGSDSILVTTARDHLDGEVNLSRNLSAFLSANTARARTVVARFQFELFS